MSDWQAWPIARGGGWFELSTGEKVRGEQPARRAQGEIDGRGADGDNLRAVQVTLQHLRDTGRVEPVDEAMVVAVQKIAVELDLDGSNAQLWKQYREYLAALVDEDDEVDGALAEALAEIRNATPSQFAS